MSKLDTLWMRTPFVLKVLIITAIVMVMAASEPIIRSYREVPQIITSNK